MIMPVLNLCSLFFASSCLFLILQATTVIAKTPGENTKHKGNAVLRDEMKAGTDDLINLSKKMEVQSKLNPNYEMIRATNYNGLGDDHSASI
ncbi:hypothetical protein WDU94_010933 [Cyamophila willieti]